MGIEVDSILFEITQKRPCDPECDGPAAQGKCWDQPSTGYITRRAQASGETEGK